MVDKEHKVATAVRAGKEHNAAKAVMLYHPAAKVGNSRQAKSYSPSIRVQQSSRSQKFQEHSHHSDYPGAQKAKSSKSKDKENNAEAVMSFHPAAKAGFTNQTDAHEHSVKQPLQTQKLREQSHHTNSPGGQKVSSGVLVLPLCLSRNFY
jgi:hypothetical protein